MTSNLYAKFQSKIITMQPPTNGVKYKRLMGGRAYMHTEIPANGTEVDVFVVASKIKQLQQDVAKNFIGRDELSQAISLAIVIGEHLFVEGAPGTAKSSLLRLFAEGIGGDFWRVVMNPDLPRDELVGTLDPNALAQGQWRRNWAGVATCDIAFIDEIWKSSPQVINILLDALEERRVSSGGEDINIPLLTAMSASNEFPDKRESHAAFDRFLLRVLVDYVNDMDLFKLMLFAEAGTVPITIVATANEVRLVAAYAEVMAKNAGSIPIDVLDTILSFRREFAHLGVSDRRWQKLVKAICGMALLDGTPTPTPRHAMCARWIVLSEKADAKDITAKVYALCDPMAGVVLTLEGALIDLQEKIKTAKTMSSDGKMELGRNINRLKQDTIKVSKDSRIDEYHYRVETILNGCQDLVDNLY